MKKAFTLTEVLLATAIVGVIATLVIPHYIPRLQNGLLDEAKSRNQNLLEVAIDMMPVVENTSFFNSIMYLDETASDYESTAGAFMKKYMKVAKGCNGDSAEGAKECFASTYKNDSGNTIDVVGNWINQVGGGYCAILKNGASLCLRPQIDDSPIFGLLDVNGKKGPNVEGKDISTIEIPARIRSANRDGNTEKPVEEEIPEDTTCTDAGGVVLDTIKGCMFNRSKDTDVYFETAKNKCDSISYRLPETPELMVEQDIINEIGQKFPIGLGKSKIFWTGTEGSFYSSPLGILWTVYTKKTVEIECPKFSKNCTASRTETAYSGRYIIFIDAAETANIICVPQ